MLTRRHPRIDIGCGGIHGKACKCQILKEQL